VSTDERRRLPDGPTQVRFGDNKDVKAPATNSPSWLTCGSTESSARPLSSRKRRRSSELQPDLYAGWGPLSWAGRRYSGFLPSYSGHWEVAMAGDISGPPAGSSSSEHADVAGLSAADSGGAGQPPGAVDALPPVAAAEGPQPSPQPGKPRKLLYVTLPGCWGALILACLSFTPSLLPRGGIVQGLVCGITAAIGYGLGVLVASIWRAFADRTPGIRGAGPGPPSLSARVSCSLLPSGSASTGSMRSAS
jgi:hypothetical protein